MNTRKLQDSNSSEYRQVIKAEFQRRRREIPFYSLRNFAKDLDLSPSHLSHILSGVRGLSKKNAFAVALRLGLRGFTARRFYFLVIAESGRSRSGRNLARMGLQKKYI